MINVLFVCLGNICRSPMAEAVFMHKVREAELQHEIAADSAGTGDWHVGAAPHSGTQDVLRSEKIDYVHAARAIAPQDFSRFDLICTMDDDNYDVVTSYALQSKSRNKPEVRRFMEFAPRTGFNHVPDPYYDGNFARTFDLVSEAADGLLAHLRSEHKL